MEARQPEASGKIQASMIISAALIEGAALFALLFLNSKTFYGFVNSFRWFNFLATQLFLLFY
jgi:hypothetical protein